MARAQGDCKRGRKKNGITSHVLIFFLCISLMTLGKADISAMNSLRTIMTGLTMPIADVVAVPVRAVTSMVESAQAAAKLREENLTYAKMLNGPAVGVFRLNCCNLKTDNCAP